MCAPNQESDAADASYLTYRVDAFLDLVAARQPAPGGGSVAAITASLAAALVTMAARYSVAGMADGDRLVGDAERLRCRAARLADEDAKAYGGVLAAGKAVHEDGSPDRQELSRALKWAAEVPLEIAEVGAETARLAGVLAVEGKPDLHGDAATALRLAEAATRSAAHLVTINITACSGDEELIRRATDCVATARDAAAFAHLPL